MQTYLTFKWYILLKIQLYFFTAQINTDKKEGIFSAQVKTLDDQTARISWTMSPVDRNRAVEIVYSPVGAR